MISFKELMEELTTPPGNYVSASVKNFPHVEWLKDSKNIDPDNAHIALMHSKESSMNPQEVLEEAKKFFKEGDACQPVSLAKFDSQEDPDLCCLVLKVSGDCLTKCHEHLKDIGLTHSYEEFSPHVTLVYDIPVSEAQKYIETVDPKSFGDLVIDGLKSTRIDKDWSSKLSN
jgi:2'-5' RNA ligase